MGGNISAEIPKTMKRLVLVRGNTDITKVRIEVEEVEVPTPKSGQVLIRVCAAPVNPSDYGIWKKANLEEENKGPMSMGKEGCGVVVASGGGVVAGRMVGKKVGFVCIAPGQGSYAEYVVVTALTSAYPLPKDVKVEDAASFFVNPYTAFGIYDTAISRGSPGIVHTGACSQLGQMLNKFVADKPGFTLINVVRRQEQSDILKSLGAAHVVVTGGNDGWKEELKALMEEHKITCVFDCVSGEIAGDLVSLTPNKGTYFTYGGLSGQPCSIPPIDLIYRNVKVEGFFLPTYLAASNQVASLRRISRASTSVLPALSDGWSASKFTDCKMEDMFTQFVEMWNSGFTNRKLRIRMMDTATEEALSKVTDEAKVVGNEGNGTQEGKEETVAADE